MLEKFCSISFSMRGIPTNTESINYITQKYKYWDVLPNTIWGKYEVKCKTLNIKKHRRDVF